MSSNASFVNETHPPLSLTMSLRVPHPGRDGKAPGRPNDPATGLSDVDGSPRTERREGEIALTDDGQRDVEHGNQRDGRNRMRHFKSIVSLLAVMGLIVAACGGGYDDPQPAATDTDETPD